VLVHRRINPPATKWRRINPACGDFGVSQGVKSPIHRALLRSWAIHRPMMVARSIHFELKTLQNAVSKGWNVS